MIFWPQEIAALLSKVFHDADLVPSDILAGLLLMHYRHNKERSLIADQYLFSTPSSGVRFTQRISKWRIVKLKIVVVT
jgi:hypothetical protein